MIHLSGRPFVQRINLALLLGGTLLGFGCGSATPATPAAPGTSGAALACEDQPISHPDGTATLVGCSFYQQDYNIKNHGTSLSSTGKSLTAGATSPGVVVTTRCGSWLLGKDSQGVEVFINQDSGEVRSHGSMHTGQQLSALPSSLPLPVQVAP